MKVNVKSFVMMMLILVFALAGCSSQSTSGQKSSADSSAKTSTKTTNKDTLVIGLDADPPQLDPHKSTAAVDRQVYQSLYDTLVTIDENLNLKPGLAKSWDISSDGKTYTFHLQQNVKFQDGTPFNAEAVKFNFERMLNKDFGSPRRSEINLISHIKVVDDQTLQVTLSKPYAPFLAVLTDRAGMMVSPTAVKKEGKDFANHPVGTGPYKFVERVKQDHIKLTRFDGYWGKKPAIKNVVYKPYPDGDTRVTNLTSGNVDIVNQIAYKDIKKLKNNSNITLSEKEALGFQGIILNVKAAPFTNKKVREALNYAIDRQAIAKVVFFGGVQPAVSPFPPSSWANPSDMKVPNVDVAKAKQLIADSGEKNLSFTLKIPPKPESKQLGQMIQSMLGQVGIKVKLDMVEFGTLLQQLQDHKYQAMLLGWSGRTDPDGNAYSWFTTNGGLNDFGYSNAKVDSLLSKARTISDQKQRAQLYDQVSHILWDDAPYIFLYHPKDYKAMKKNVKGFVHVPDTMIRTDSMYFK